MAFSPCSGRDRRTRCQSAQLAVALENSGQPAPQRDRSRYFRPLSCRLVLHAGRACVTAGVFALLLIPSYVQAVLAMIRHRNSPHKRGVFAQLAGDFATTQVNVPAFLAFLPHQALVTLDATARAVIRLTVTHKKLLEWETAAQSEMDTRRTAVDVYLKLTPIITIAIAIGFAVYSPRAPLAPPPTLFLWLL